VLAGTTARLSCGNYTVILKFGPFSHFCSISIQPHGDFTH